MSGLFLTVWCDDQYDLLNATKGGYPHITIFYSGKTFTHQKLIDFGMKTLEILLHDCKTLPLFTLRQEDVVLSSFFEKSTKKQRYDVLLNLDKKSREFVEKIRTELKLGDFGDDIFMQTPHVTQKIFYSEQEANDYKDMFTKQMPIDIQVTGFTID